MPDLTVTPKEKVDFSLDNRQVFFLFFGLSVVGCFVFALGVMVGRRDELGQANAQMVAQNDARAAVLAEPEALVADAGYSFKDGLLHPATEGVPETRDPGTPPRDEDTVRAERQAAQGKLPGKDKKPSKKAIPAGGKEPAMASAPKLLPPLASEPPLPAKQPAAKQPTKEPAKEPAKDSKPAQETVVAAVKGDTADKAEKTDAAARSKKGFALQMKAFTSQGDADKLAEKLRRNGHEVRIESGETSGRLWHRVRLGEFNSWDAAVTAKQTFEKQEAMIAYVVSL